MNALDLPALGLVLFVTGALVVIAVVAILNAFTFPRLRVARPDEASGLAAAVGSVSVLIPARDEAASIGTTVGDLLSQSPPPLEIVVLDDGSSDGTADLARAAGERATAEGAPGAGRLRVLSGAPLEPGWAGKPWACRQLADAARGDRLLFTDADTRWAPGALEALVLEARRTGSDLLTAWPTQTTVTWGERLTVPLIAFSVLGYLPALAAHSMPLRIFTAANGQCLLFTRETYERIGGHGAVRGEVLDDVALGRRVKHAFRRLRMVDGAGFIGCRMYRDWPSVRDGFGKNILAGFGGHLGLALSTLFHWLVLLGPWTWLALGWAVPDLGAGSSTTVGILAGSWPGWPLALVGLGIGVRALTAGVSLQRRRDALLLPISVLLLTLVAIRAVTWARTGGPRWKGRVVAARRP